MNEENFIAKNGVNFKITIDDFGEEIEVFHEKNLMGSISLNYTDESDIS